MDHIDLHHHQPMGIMIFRFPLTLVFALFALQSMGAENTIHDDVISAIKSFSGSQTQISPIDPRLQLKKCDSALQVRFPFNSEKTVEVQCPDSSGWKIYLSVINTAQSNNDNATKTVAATPNKVTAEASSASAVVSSNIIRRGIPIKASDLSVRAFPSHRINEGHFKRPNELIGFEATQTIPKGALISLNMVRQPSIIKKGATVTIIYDKNGIFVSNEGVALKDAGIRQTVDVYIPKTNKTVTGVVDTLGRVKIN